MKHRHFFTLMETMIAATILAISVAATMSIIGGARSSLLRAESRWARQHLLTQVAELYLLGGPTAPIPQGILPPGFSSSCQVAAVEDLEDAALEENHGWILAEYAISLMDENGITVADTLVQKVLKKDDVE